MRPGWRNEPFDAVIADESGGNVKTPQSEFLPAGRYAVVDQGKELIAGYVNDESRLCRATLPAIVFGDHTRCFKYVDFPFCMGADGVKVLRPKIDADVKYLYHYLRQLRLTEGGYDRHFKYLKRSSVVLPPLPEQRRIAEILDKADALQAKRRAALAQLDTLTQSIFLDMFGDPATNPKGWPRKEIRVLAKVSTGGTPPSAKPGMFGGPIPFITPGDLESDESVKRTLTEAGADESVTVRRGATFVCCIGATIGKIGKAGTRSAFNQQINAVEWGEAVDDTYGLHVLRFFKPTIVAWGASTTLPILKKSAFERIEVPVPPLDLQRDFSQRIDEVERIRSSCRKALGSLLEMFGSLQSRAFHGEL
jgi:type I restriction enzyme S subunit